MKEAKELVMEIRQEIDRIWTEEPLELRKIRLGFIDSGAGSYGQYFSTLVFVDGEVRALGYLCLGSLVQLSDDPVFDLDRLKKMAFALLPVCAEFLGYCGLEELWGFHKRFLALLEEEITREDFKELVRALSLYVNRLHGWIHFYFPWGLGTQFRLKTRQEIEQLKQLIEEGKQGKGSFEG